MESFKDAEEILNAIGKASKNTLTPNEQIALKTAESILRKKQKEELSIDDIEQLMRNLNFLKQDILAKVKEPIEILINNLDGKESIYF